MPIVLQKFKFSVRAPSTTNMPLWPWPVSRGLPPPLLPMVLQIHLCSAQDTPSLPGLPPGCPYLQRSHGHGSCGAGAWAMYCLPGLTLELPGNPGLRQTPVAITRPHPDLQIEFPTWPWPVPSPQTGLATRTLADAGYQCPVRPTRLARGCGNDSRFPLLLLGSHCVCLIF